MPSKPKTPRTSASDPKPAVAIPDHVLEAARAVMADGGWAAATMERIAEAAGISRVTLHRNRITKDAIMRELSVQGAERYRAKMWPALTAEGTGAERLSLAIDALCDAAEADMHVVLALGEASDQVFHAGDERGLTRTEFTLPLERILRDGKNDKSLRADDPEETATVLFNLVGWTYIHLRTGHGWQPERARHQVAEIALHGLLT